MYLITLNLMCRKISKTNFVAKCVRVMTFIFPIFPKTMKYLIVVDFSFYYSLSAIIKTWVCKMKTCLRTLTYLIFTTPHSPPCSKTITPKSWLLVGFVTEMKRSLFRLVAFKKQLGVSSRTIHQDLKTQIQRFDASIPVEKAITPPSSWFTHQLFHDLDKVSNCSNFAFLISKNYLDLGLCTTIASDLGGNFQ